MIEARFEPVGFVINGCAISEAVDPRQLHETIGSTPDRIVDPAAPAPFGHRNNLIHVYDSLGLYFHEHHATRLATDLVFAWWPEEEGFAFSPRCAFSGCLRLGEYRVPLEATESEVIRNCPIRLTSCVRGSWRTERDGFGLGITTKGPKLKSGRRSARRRVVSIDVSWPHDPWRIG